VTRRLAPAGLLVALITPFAAGRQQSPQQTTFHSATDLVTVAVSVKNGNVPVTGLTADAFELRDNDVPQQIDAVSIEVVPVDVSLVIDLSSSVLNDATEFAADVGAFTRMLRPIDRVRIVTFGSGVTEAVSMQPATSTLDLTGIRMGGATSLNDALLYGLIWPKEPDRSHLVIVLTDGYDSLSTLDSDSLPDVAGRVDAVLHTVLFDWQGLITPGMRASQVALIEATRRTGGEMHRPGRVLDDFSQILDDFRASYVLRYTARNVTRGGWHNITVTLRRAQAEKFTVRARKGYGGG
jgi:VWFA-related protein